MMHSLPVGRILLSQEAGLTDEQVGRIREAAVGASIELCDLQRVCQRAPQSEILAGNELGITTDIFREPGLLRWVHLFQAGVDRILCPELIESGITLTCAKGAHAVPIAEHTFAFMLAHVKELVRHRQAQRERIWDRHALGELYGKTLCVVGLGNIGSEVARRSACFGMHVVGTRRSGAPVPYVERVVPPDRLAEVLSDADYVVLTLPFSPETKGMIGVREIAWMKPGAFVINVCRGQVLDHRALINALKSGHVAGAGLDATDPEPLPAESELWHLPNVIITPHDSAMSCVVRDRAVDMFCENLKRYHNGEPLLQVVDKGAGY